MMKLKISLTKNFVSMKETDVPPPGLEELAAMCSFPKAFLGSPPDVEFFLQVFSHDRMSLMLFPHGYVTEMRLISILPEDGPSQLRDELYRILQDALVRGDGRSGIPLDLVSDPTKMGSDIVGEVKGSLSDNETLITVLVGYIRKYGWDKSRIQKENLDAAFEGTTKSNPHLFLLRSSDSRKGRRYVVVPQLSKLDNLELMLSFYIVLSMA